MIKKTIKPIIGEKSTDNYGLIYGTIIEYRLFGMLVCKKTYYTPRYYGFNRWDDYPIRF